MAWYDFLPPGQREKAAEHSAYLATCRLAGISPSFPPTHPGLVGDGIAVDIGSIAPTPDWVREAECFHPGKPGIWNCNYLGAAPAPRILHVTHRADTVTNARLKRYLFKDTLQVCNDDIFSTADFERRDGKSKRVYDVAKAGEAIDPKRSLEESKRRAKGKVRDIALCNRFEYMFTWTLDPELVDRYDPAAVYKKVRSFLSNATQRKNFRYVCIPEYHTMKAEEEKPAIHMHGLCIPGSVELAPSLLPSGCQRTDKNGRQIFNMVDWPLGFSTCVLLDEKYEKAVNYVTKYITKAETKIFGKWYLSSRILEKSPEIVPLERMDFEQFRDEIKLERKEQIETIVYRDVKIVSEEYERDVSTVCSSG